MATTRLQIGPADAGRAMTMDEFREADSRPGSLYELARGTLDVVEVPGDQHWRIVDNVHEVLSRYRAANPGVVTRVGHGSDVRIVVEATESDRHPDLAVAFSDAAVDSQGRPVPALVVEVVSPGARAQRRDMVEKREEYLAAGLDEYWAVDPRSRRVTVMIRQGAAWSESVYEGDRPIASGRLPGLLGTPASFWAGLANGGDDADD